MNPVRSAVVALLSVILIVLAPVLLVFSSDGDSAHAETVSTCPVIAGIKDGNTITITACGQAFSVDINDLANGSLELGSIALPPGVTITETVTRPPIKVPGPTVRVRGPKTKVPGPTVTLPPKPRATVTIPGPTSTVTVRPNNTRPSQAPAGPTRTVTVTPSPSSGLTRQPITPSGTVEPTPEPSGDNTSETRTKTETIVRRVVAGTLALTVLAALAILALWLGYILGYKGAERQEVRSLRNMLDLLKSSGKHS